MERRDSDRLVIFGATGDLCYKKIYPALYNLVRRGVLTVVGVARAGWNTDQYVAHVRKSVAEHVKQPESAVVEKLAGLLRYVDGDYGKSETFDALFKALDNSQRPLFYLAIPPSVFPVVIGHLSKQRPEGARVVVEKPFGRDLASAQALNRSGIATSWRVCRSPWPRRSAWRAAASSTKRRARFATSSRIT
jgi:glucose-6-phosphate 1-dehydrogenase